MFALAFALGCGAGNPSAPPVSQHHILILGDSVANGAGDEARIGLSGHLDAELTRAGIAHTPTINAAMNGARTWHMASRLRDRKVRDEVKHATVLVVSIGGNDLFGDSRARLLSLIAPRLSIDLTIDRVEELVKRLRAMNGNARIFVVSVYNSYRGSAIGRVVDPYVAIWTSELLARFSGDANVTIVPIADLFSHHERRSTIDHYHPSAEGYALIARRIAESL